MIIKFANGDSIEINGSQGFRRSVLQCIEPILAAHLAVGGITYPDDTIDALKHEIRLAKEASAIGQGFKGQYIENLAIDPLPTAAPIAAQGVDDVDE